MARFLPVTNGRLFVGFDEHHRIRELTYPHVGKDNHAGSAGFRVGALVGKEFLWVGHQDLVSHKYRDRTMTGQVLFEWTSPGPWSLGFEDWVDLDLDVFLRRATVTNRTEEPSEITLFFHQDFTIRYSDIGDTALHRPDPDVLVHYKDKRYFLAGVLDPGHGQGRIREFACGKKHGSQEGTWKDAEDGRLSGNPIAQGAVDSVFSVALSLAPGASKSFTYIIVCGDSEKKMIDAYQKITEKGVERSLGQSEGFWNFWIDSHVLPLDPLPDGARTLYEMSLILLRTHWDSRGAVVAAVDSESLNYSRDTYSYLWPRDAAIIAHALDLAGFGDLTRDFYSLLPSLLSDRGYLHHKYHPNLSIGSSWHPFGRPGAPLYPIQADETALPIWALYHHFERYRDLDTIRPIYHHFVLPAARFLASFRDKDTGLPLPSYDLWEERGGVATYTAASVFAGLTAAAAFADGFGDRVERDLFRTAAEDVRKGILNHLYDNDSGVFLRGFVLDGSGDLAPDPTPDAAIASLFQFQVLSEQDIRLIRTMDWLEDELWVDGPIGGMARYRNDAYYQQDPSVPGNPWVIATLWLLQWKIATTLSPHSDPQIRFLISWVLERAGQSGMLPEQVHPGTGARLSVSPLAWSHAEWVIAVSRLARHRAPQPHPWEDP